MHHPPSIALASPKVGRMDMPLLLNSEKVVWSSAGVKRREREKGDEGRMARRREGRRKKRRQSRERFWREMRGHGLRIRGRLCSHGASQGWFPKPQFPQENAVEASYYSGCGRELENRAYIDFGHISPSTTHTHTQTHTHTHRMQTSREGRRTSPAPSPWSITRWVWRDDSPNLPRATPCLASQECF